MLKAVVRVNLRTREAQERGRKWARTFAANAAKRVRYRAQRNVAPGRGPGPHPHRTGSKHEDAGELMRDVHTHTVHRGFMEEVKVYTNTDYGVYLEVGWHTKAGTFYRYPWLYPALAQNLTAMREIARITGAALFGSGRGSGVPEPSYGTYQEGEFVP